ncbi:MAG: universal stress protein [Dissulfuribacterales bacterium]
MKILLAYRGASSHTEGVRLTKEYAKIFKAEVFIGTSLMFGDKDRPFALISSGKDRPFAVVEKGDMSANIESIEELFRSEEIPCKRIIFERLNPGIAIVKYAKDHEIDLIIIGVRSRSRVGKMLLGSNAQYVLLNSHCPVLTYKEVKEV